MAKGRKTGGKDFKPGVVTNPSGRPKLPEDIKQARELNKIELERLLNLYMSKTSKELTEIIGKEETPAIEKIICKIVSIAMDNGDHFRFDFLLNRLIGKVSEKHELTGKDGAPLVNALTDEQLEAKIAAHLKAKP